MPRIMSGLMSIFDQVEVSGPAYWSRFMGGLVREGVGATGPMDCGDGHKPRPRRSVGPAPLATERVVVVIHEHKRYRRADQGITLIYRG